MTAVCSVYDGVFSPASCAVLHNAAQQRGLGHALYSRGGAGPSSPLEHAFEHFLSEIGDDSPHVEYWSRQEWRHIEAHADADEALAAGGGALRFPRHAHVLYLDVGTKVSGPTCIWEPSAGNRFGGALTTVPAVEGRVLRFDGELQHAVPRPADVWLAPFVINQSGKPEEFMRSVVLFNCWPDIDAPPLDVHPEEAPAASSALSEEDVALFTGTPRASWQSVDLHPKASSCEKLKTMKLWLLGDEARRGQPERTLPMPVDADVTMAALAEASACTRIEPATAPSAEAR